VQRSVTLRCRLETLECKHHVRGNEITVGNTHTHTHTLLQTNVSDTKVPVPYRCAYP